MKKAILLLCMAAGLMSCAKEVPSPQGENPENEGVPMTFNVTVLETKAAKTDWADGDKIYVFFNGLATKYLVLTFDGTEWANTSGGGTLLDTDFSGLGTKKLTAVHFPVTVNVSYADSKFSFTRGGKPVYNYYLFEADRTYTVDGTTVYATLSMGKPADMVQIHVAGIQGNVGNYTFGCSKIRPVACASVGTDGIITESLLQAGARLSGVADSDGGIFAGRLVYPSEAKNYKFTLASNTQIYTLTRNNKTLTAGKMYNFPSLSTTGGSNWAVQNASDLYVDLDLTVDGKKIYWAKCNLGATSETEYGDYFAWGETTGYMEGKTNFGWSTYAWGNESRALTKYCKDSSYGKDGFTDGLTTLLPEDDAAYAALGGKFRMPTRAELEYLSYVTRKWVDNYKDSGVSGFTFTRNGQTIFLPAAGYWENSSLQTPGMLGGYWSSSNEGKEEAWGLNFLNSNFFSNPLASEAEPPRYGGLSIRPVFSN